jgi:hypothetical protein
VDEERQFLFTPLHFWHFALPGPIFKADPGYSDKSLLSGSTVEAAFMQEPPPAADMAFTAKFKAPAHHAASFLEVSVKVLLPGQA